VKSSFPKLDAVNRGLSGSQIRDVHQLAGRLVFRYNPKVLVFYGGENDIASGHTAEMILNSYRAFVAHVKGHLSEIQIVYISIKPSPVLQRLWARSKKANELIEEFCDNDPNLYFVDVATPMLKTNGKPRPELFQGDGLHMNKAGYVIWTRLVSPVVEVALAKTAI